MLIKETKVTIFFTEKQQSCNKKSYIFNIKFTSSITKFL